MGNQLTERGKRKDWRKKSFPVTSMDLTIGQIQTIEMWERENIFYEWSIIKVDYRRSINHPEVLYVFWYCSKFIPQTSNIQNYTFVLKLNGDSNE